MKKRRINYFSIMLQIIILFYCLLISVFENGSLTDGLIYFVFQFFFVFIPGFALYILLKKENISTEKKILFSYFFGIVLLVLEYYFCMLSGISEYSFFVSLFIAAFSAWFIYKNKYHVVENRNEGKQSYILLLLVVLVISICYCSVSLANPLPIDYELVAYNKDFLFWIGNSISFAKGLPVQNFRLVGEVFYYHYFSSVVIAQTHLITNINIVEISYRFSFIIPSVLLVFSAYYMFRTLLNNTLFVFFGIVFSLFAEGSTVFMANHLFFCPFGFDYGFAFAMMSVGYLLNIYQKDDFSVKNVLTSCLMIMMITGFKGPTGVVVLILFGLTSLEMLLNRKWKKGLLCGIAWLVSFLIVYFVFIVDISGATEQTNGLIFLGPLKAFDQNYWAIEIMNEMISKYGMPDNGITRMISLFLYIFRSNKAASSLLMVGALFDIYYCIKYKKLDSVTTFLIGISFWGILLTVNTHQDGNSQMYFVMATFPFSILAGLNVLERTGSRRGIAYLFLLLIFLLSFTDLKRFTEERVYSEIENSISIRNHKETEGDQRYSFSCDDYEMSLWLKYNTESADVVAVDCFEYDGFRKEEGFGVFSERFIWNDGQYANEKERERRRSCVKDVFTDQKHDISVLKEEGVKYLVQTLSQNSDPIPDGNIVYQNNSYIVYQLY